VCLLLHLPHDDLVTGKLYTWGWNAYGQCGVSKKEEAILEPTLVSSLAFYSVTDVQCGEQHTICVVSEIGN